MKSNLQIVIEFTLPIGKKKYNRKIISLIPENVPHEMIIHKKLNCLKDKVNELDGQIANINAINQINIDSLNQLSDRTQYIEDILSNSKHKMNGNEFVVVHAICQQIIVERFEKLRNLLIEDIKTYNKQ